MSQLPSKKQFLIRSSGEQLARLDAFRWEHRQRSLTQAIETLIEMGLEAAARQAKEAA